MWYYIFLYKCVIFKTLQVDIFLVDYWLYSLNITALIFQILTRSCIFNFIPEINLLHEFTTKMFHKMFYFIHSSCTFLTSHCSELALCGSWQSLHLIVSSVVSSASLFTNTNLSFTKCWNTQTLTWTCWNQLLQNKSSAVWKHRAVDMIVAREVTYDIMGLIQQGNQCRVFPLLSKHNCHRYHHHHHHHHYSIMCVSECRTVSCLRTEGIKTQHKLWA